MEDNEKVIFESEDRDEIIKKLIEQDRIDHAESHLGDTQRLPVKTHVHERGYNYYTELNPYEGEEGISMVIAPPWGIIFPPYNMARLSSVWFTTRYRI